jgi:hypothetical protein
MPNFFGGHIGPGYVNGNSQTNTNIKINYINIFGPVYGQRLMASISEAS